MRTILSTLAIVGLGLPGCSGVPMSRAPEPSRATPVVLEPPKVSEWLRYNRKQQDEQASTVRTRVEGNVIR